MMNGGEGERVEDGEQDWWEEKGWRKDGEDEGGKFPGAPEAFDDAEMVERHGGDEKFGAVCVACLDAGG